ncbi:MAG: LexA family transcriptional regulator [Culturomica sp.]|jgi:hypothetical protein|nr:LexA family transcriptional regulator [Culturomica sp.]
MSLNKLMSFIEYKGMSMGKFEKSINAPNATIQKLLKGKGNIMSDKLENIARVYPELNLDWLLRDDVNMIKDAPNFLYEPIIAQNINPKPHIVADEGNIVDFKSLLSKGVSKKLFLPVNNYDFSLEMRGNSMYNPAGDRSIKDGDLLTCKFCDKSSAIQWGEVYAFITKVGISVKILSSSDKAGYVSCIALNPDSGYQPYDIPFSDILDYAMVKSVVSIARW